MACAFSARQLPAIVGRCVAVLVLLIGSEAGARAMCADGAVAKCGEEVMSVVACKNGDVVGVGRRAYYRLTRAGNELGADRFLLPMHYGTLIIEGNTANTLVSVQYPHMLSYRVVGDSISREVPLPAEVGPGSVAAGGRLVASLGRYRGVVFDAVTAEVVTRLEYADRPAKGHAISGDGSELAQFGDHIVFRSLPKGTEIEVFDPPENSVFHLLGAAFCPSKRQFAVVEVEYAEMMSRHSIARILDRKLAKWMRIATVDPTGGVCFSDDGMNIAICSGRHTIEVWDLRKSPRLVGSVKTEEKMTRALVFARGGDEVIAGTERGMVVFDVRKLGME
jgi:hypothetical protein